MNKWFKPLNSKPVKRDIMAFDIEGAGGAAGFVCGVIRSEFTYNFFTDRAAMWEALLSYASSGAWVFSFNLEYDLPILAGDELWTGNLIFTKSGILHAEYFFRGKKVKFYDAANLFPRWSVKTVGNMINCPKLEVSAEIMKRLAAGAPWGTFTKEEQKDIEKYCSRDAEVVYRAVMTLQELALEIGGELHPTIAGIAMNVYRRRFHKWPWPVISPQTNETARLAYYGGRTENFYYGHIDRVNMYDITSLYPYVQSRVRFPHPGHLEFDATPKLTGPWWEWEGVANVTIKVPDSFIPPLPYRHDERLFFPVGTLTSTWSIWELREALIRGCKIVRVHWVMGTKITFNPFVDYVDQLFGLRDAFLSEGSPKANLIKLILNSLYGRFGINVTDGLTQMKPILKNTNLDNMQGWATKELGGFLVGIGRIESMSYPTYANAFFAAQVSSAARIELLYGLDQQGEQSAYCDTDSIITTGIMPVSTSLGGWRAEAENAAVDLHGPKEYVLYNGKDDPKYVVKSVPSYKAAEYVNTGQVDFYRAVSIREAVSRNMSPADWAQVFYTKQMNYPKRRILDPAALDVMSFSLTRPWGYSELPNAVNQQARILGLLPMIPKPLYPAEPL